MTLCCPGAGFVLARLVAFPSDVAALVILQVVGPRGEVTGARVVGLPVRVVEDLLLSAKLVTNLSEGGSTYPLFIPLGFRGFQRAL